MMVKAKDLKIGQVINIEYGDYDNWVKFEVDGVSTSGNSTDVLCHRDSICNEFTWKADNLVEVVS